MTRTLFIGIAAMLFVGLTSCTLEKRHYRNGYYFNRPGAERPVNETTAEPEEAEAKIAEAKIAEAENEPVASVDTSRFPVADSAAVDSTVTKSRIERSIETIPEQVYRKLPKKVQASPPLIEKDKKQATGAGVAAAIFFVLAMAGLVIKGTAPPVGIFIVAAFVCCLLCIMLASFLYPRDPVVKQPKDETVIDDKGIAAIGIGLLIVVFSILVLFFGLLLSIFTDLFF